MKTHIVRTVLASLILLPSVHAENLFTNGSADDDVPTFFLNETVELSIHQGNPVTGFETGDEKSFALKFLQDAMDRPVAVGMKEQIYVDPTKRYRFRISFHSTGEATITAGGYAMNEESAGKPLTKPDGAVWQYNVASPDGKRVLNTPTTEWVEMQAVIGPEGSEADYFWLPETLMTGMAMWITAPADTVVYMDNISAEELD